MFITVPNRFFVSDKFCGSGAFGWNSVHPFSKILRAPTNGRRSSSFKASLISNPDAFEVGKFIGSYGYMNVTSYSSVQSGGPSSVGLFVDLDAGYSSEDVEQLKVQDVGEGQVKIRLYEGRVALGPLRGARVIFKVYPGNRAGGAEADMMAANELNAHAYLQSDRKSICPNIQILLGGFETKTGEQWLAFRNDGKYSAADYAKASSETLTRDPAQGENKFWNPFDLDQTFKRRHLFIIKLLHGAMNGLAYMHERGRLHQSIGPASVVLNTIVERDAAYLVPRLRDLAFSVDTCNSPLEAVPGAFSEGLWRRATAAGAFTTAEKKAFGIADDIYEAGLLFAYLAFVPFCEAGVMDALSLQRLFESTFKLDLVAAREYCEADDRLSEAVRFLDLGGGGGWELLQAMLNPDFRQRPVTQTVLMHRFLTDKTIGG
ncbi:serine/threonine-protein kinase STN7, chloroplastic isoform X2 [Aristolochia californica]|uniref:serine/threonine-protein kinase STN7, chloroplastic isoform X2 n=1 Tax=Aristolochia californica TaxID=171875 RepID=UPI0035D9A519